MLNFFYIGDLEVSYEEKNTLLQIIVGIVINIWIVIEVRGLYANGVMDSPEAIQTWAKTILWIIIVSILAGILFTIMGTIIFSILEKIIFGKSDTNFITDERDKTIASIGHKITIFFAGAGFITLLVGLNFGYEIVDCLVVLMFCFSLGGLLGELAKLVRYRVGI